MDEEPPMLVAVVLVTVEVMAVAVAVAELVEDGGGRPRLDNDVTEYPSKRARRQMVCPKNPVPPRTSNFPLLSDGVPLVVLLLLMLMVVVLDLIRVDVVIQANPWIAWNGDGTRRTHAVIHRGTLLMMAETRKDFREATPTLGSYDGVIQIDTS
jgi:hypothetical protein